MTPPKARGCGAKEEDGREEVGDADADAARHFHVVDAGSNHGADPGPFKKQIQ